MNDPVARLETAARLDNVGIDIRSRSRFERPPLHVRRELAAHVVGLVQGGANVLLRGPSGVGKTAFVHSLALAEWPSRQLGQLRLVEAPDQQAGPPIIEVTPARLVSGTFFANELEHKCEIVFGTARAKSAVLFLDNLHTFVGSGSSSNDPQGDLANILVPHIERGLQIIAATTPEGEARLRAGNERLHGRFVVVDVPEPDPDDAREIVIAHFEALRRSGIDASVSLIEPGLELAARHLPGEPSFAGLLRAVRRSSAGGTVTTSALRRAFAEEIGVLPGFVRAGEAPTCEAMVEELSAEVFGQDEAVAEVADALVRFSAGLVERGRPLASFLFAGPSGCGKTSLALAASRALTGGDAGLVRFDMSEYAQPDAVGRLIADNGSSLASLCASRRGGVLLLDEIEQAHPSVVRLLLQVLGEARLTDSAGRTVRFESFLVVMTTNVGSGRWRFSPAEDRAVSLVLADVSAAFPTEFRARLTRTMVFRPIGGAAAERIVERELQGLNMAPGLVDRGLQVVWGEQLVETLCTCGVSSERGARGVQSVVRSLVTTPLARWLAEHDVASNGLVMVVPRIEGGVLASLHIEWVDEGGFFRELAN